MELPVLGRVGEVVEQCFGISWLGVDSGSKIRHHFGIVLQYSLLLREGTYS